MLNSFPLSGIFYVPCPFTSCCHPAAASHLNKATHSGSVMASAPPSTDVGEEVLCPICQDFLTDPVTLDCGHNFCQGCITKHCEIRDEIDMGDCKCPVCMVKIQSRNFCRNWQLANVAERLKLQRKQLCEKHKEKLHLFCKQDEELVCLVCERCPEHKSHTVVLKEEVAQEYKTLICDRLEHLKKEREKIQAYEAKIGKESNSLLRITETERQKTMEKFRQLHQFLEEQEKRLLNEIEEMEKEITRRREKHLAGLSEELSSLERSIREMEEKSQQPASELLQDVRRTLQRCERRGTSENPLTFPLELKRKISKFRAAIPILYLGEEKIKDALLSRLLQKANVTLDPDTAHPCLILSEDGKSVRREYKDEALPDNPERFSDWPCVLGCEGFTAGRHFWEVNMGSEELWAIGVARKSMGRKGLFSLRPERGIWAVGKWHGKYKACTSPHCSPLSLSEEPRRIRVTLDYEGGYVSLSDADSGAELHTFSGALFFGETLLPFFCLWGYATHLRISC
ncbi:tripartite motif-containing protein 10-like [Podarcis raffonei]|uniref:tripartite motif-containing protein 10-like n=1 Tax=Podarcis raffonei TaxID=65483 RepID=UPI00232961CC|nr:tripartite motif-containing protein 10-like [Podarcis raffonei]